MKDLNWSCGDIQTTLHLNGSGLDHSFYFPNLITATHQQHHHQPIVIMIILGTRSVLLTVDGRFSAVPGEVVEVVAKVDQVA